MKKLFMLLCIVILFFGIAGCPSSDNPTPQAFTINVNNTSQVGVNKSGSKVSAGDNILAVPEPATLILLGTGLVGLAVIGRKRFKK